MICYLLSRQPLASFHNNMQLHFVIIGLVMQLLYKAVIKQNTLKGKAAMKCNILMQKKNKVFKQAN